MDWLMRWHEHLGDRLPCARWCRLTADKQRAASAHAGSRLPSSRGPWGGDALLLSTNPG
jgi:hypothetical protein